MELKVGTREWLELYFTYLFKVGLKLKVGTRVWLELCFVMPETDCGLVQA